MKTWKLMDAKIHLGRIITSSHEDGPQIITVRGKPKVVIVPIDVFNKMIKSEKGKEPNQK
jgi:antitoxin Phd